MTIKEKFMKTKKFNKINYGEIFKEPIDEVWFLYVGLDEGEWSGCIDLENGRGYSLDKFYETHVNKWLDYGDTKVEICNKAKLILK